MCANIMLLKIRKVKMTKDTKSEIRVISLGSMVVLFISFGAYLMNVKADRNELVPIQKQIDETCKEVKEHKELYHRLDRSLGRIEIILERMEKDK